MRRLASLVFALLLTIGLIPFNVGSSGVAAAGERFCFQETTYCAENAFLDFWRGNGGLEILGFPISQPFVDNRGLIVQFYERAIMEWHPENTDPRYQVLLTLLGNDLAATRPESGAAPKACDATPCTLFAETNHTLRGVFYNYWVNNGGLAVFGFPKTEEFIEVNSVDKQPYVVQYFERNRFEYHPEKETRYQVLLGLLGLESLSTQRTVLDRPVAQVPDYTMNVTAGVPTLLTISSIGVNSVSIERVGLDANNNMDVPKNPLNTAWYEPGPRPGQRGNAVIAGHVDYHGIGKVVFARLTEMKVGDQVFVTGDNGVRQRFVVTDVQVYLADSAPLDRIFGPSSTANLNLISCTGDFDPGSASYNQRIVVFTRWDGVAP